MDGLAFGVIYVRLVFDNDLDCKFRQQSSQWKCDLNTLRISFAAKVLIMFF
jgi:hypothetical protein